MSIQKPTGTQDLLPGEVEKWQYIEDKARDLCHDSIIEKSVRRYSRDTELFNEVLVKRQISSRRKCIRFWTKVIAA